MQITKYLCLNRLKSCHRRQEELTEYTQISETSTPYTQLEQKDNLTRVMCIIDQLPGLQQTILRNMEQQEKQAEKLISDSEKYREILDDFPDYKVIEKKQEGRIVPSFYRFANGKTDISYSMNLLWKHSRIMMPRGVMWKKYIRLFF